MTSIIERIAQLNPSSIQSVMATITEGLSIDDIRQLNIKDQRFLIFDKWLKLFNRRILVRVEGINFLPSGDLVSLENGLKADPPFIPEGMQFDFVRQDFYTFYNLMVADSFRHIGTYFYLGFPVINWDDIRHLLVLGLQEGRYREQTISSWQADISSFLIHKAHLFPIETIKQFNQEESKQVTHVLETVKDQWQTRTFWDHFNDDFFSPIPENANKRRILFEIFAIDKGIVKVFEGFRVTDIQDRIADIIKRTKFRKNIKPSENDRYRAEFINFIQDKSTKPSEFLRILVSKQFTPSNTNPNLSKLANVKRDFKKFEEKGTVTKLLNESAVEALKFPGGFPQSKLDPLADFERNRRQFQTPEAILEDIRATPREPPDGNSTKGLNDLIEKIKQKHPFGKQFETSGVKNGREFRNITINTIPRSLSDARSIYKNYPWFTEFSVKRILIEPVNEEANKLILPNLWASQKFYELQVRSKKRIQEGDILNVFDTDNTHFAMRIKIIGLRAGQEKYQDEKIFALEQDYLKSGQDQQIKLDIINREAGKEILDLLISEIDSILGGKPSISFSKKLAETFMGVSNNEALDEWLNLRVFLFPPYDTPNVFKQRVVSGFYDPIILKHLSNGEKSPGIFGNINLPVSALEKFSKAINEEKELRKIDLVDFLVRLYNAQQVRLTQVLPPRAQITSKEVDFKEWRTMCVDSPSSSFKDHELVYLTEKNKDGNDQLYCFPIVEAKEIITTGTNPTTGGTLPETFINMVGNMRIPTPEISEVKNVFKREDIETTLENIDNAMGVLFKPKQEKTRVDESLFGDTDDITDSEEQSVLPDQRQKVYRKERRIAFDTDVRKQFVKRRAILLNPETTPWVLSTRENEDKPTHIGVGGLRKQTQKIIKTINLQNDVIEELEYTPEQKPDRKREMQDLLNRKKREAFKIKPSQRR